MERTLTRWQEVWKEATIVHTTRGNGKWHPIKEKWFMRAAYYQLLRWPILPFVYTLQCLTGKVDKEKIHYTSRVKVMWCSHEV